MADNNDIKQYPFMFDPSQFANKYSPYAGVALPFMGGYSTAAGPPTDAHGNPIQSYLDTQAQHDAWAAANPAPAMAPPTTLNSTPQHGVGGLQPGQWDGPDGLPQGTPTSPIRTALPVMSQAGGNGGMTPNWQPSNYAATGQNYTIMPKQGGASQAAPQAAAPQNPYDMNRAYLTALANPGHVTTPGATVAQAAPPSNQSGVLQQFLANWGGNSKGAGNYDNSGFINSLRGMV